MKKILSIKEHETMSKNYDKVKYTCKRCGHRVIIPNWVEKNVCDYCGYYVFKNDKDEFKFRLKEKMK